MLNNKIFKGFEFDNANCCAKSLLLIAFIQFLDFLPL